MATQDDLNTPAIAVVGFVGAILIFAIILLLVVVFHGAKQDMESQRYGANGRLLYPQISKLTTDQQGHLAMYDRVNQKFIPITLAMELVVAELTKDPDANVTGPAAPQPETPDDTELPDKTKAEKEGKNNASS